MGASNGAEVHELVGTFPLYKLSQKYNKNKISFYRDNGLAIFKNISRPKSQKRLKFSKNCLKKMN